MDANTIPLIALLVTIVGWIYTASQQKKILEIQIKAEKEREFRNELQEKVSKVYNYLDQYANLNSLWRLKSRFSFVLPNDENEKFNPEDKEKFKVIEKYFLSDQEEVEAIKQLKGVDLDSFINQTKVSILMDLSKINDILAEIDTTKGLTDGFRNLYLKTIDRFDIIYKNPQGWTPCTFYEFYELLENASKMRIELRSQLNMIINDKVKKH